MITLFVSLKALETLALTERWNRILCKEVKDIHVYASDDELNNYLMEEADISPIANIVLSGDIKLNSSMEEIDGFIKDNSKVLNYPSGVFFLDITKDTAAEIQQKYGVICKNENDIDGKELSDEREISCTENEIGHSWSEFLEDIKKAPTNSLIINDRYLFANDEHNDIKKRNGRTNFIEILNSILPISFSSEKPYHILLIYSQQQKNNEHKLPFHKLSKELAKEVTKLRQYPIEFELLSVSENQPKYELTHNRRIITNYHIIRAEHKLQAFKDNKSTCSQVLNWNMLFSKGVLDKSDTPYKSYKQLIKDLREIAEYGKEHATSGYCYSMNGVPARNANNDPIFSPIQNRLIVNY